MSSSILPVNDCPDPATIVSLTLVADLPNVREDYTRDRAFRCWYRKGLLGLFQNFDEPPALRRRRRPGLHQRDAVADSGGAVLVVRLDLGGGPDDLAVQRVTHAVFELDHDGLLHLVADHVADAHLAAAPHLRVGRSVLGALVLRRGLGCGGLLRGGLLG